MDDVRNFFRAMSSFHVHRVPFRFPTHLINGPTCQCYAWIGLTRPENAVCFVLPKRYPYPNQHGSFSGATSSCHFLEVNACHIAMKRHKNCFASRTRPLSSHRSIDFLIDGGIWNDARITSHEWKMNGRTRSKRCFRQAALIPGAVWIDTADIITCGNPLRSLTIA